eukprot:TRINITY_DN3364_c1_g1_i1.p1 TRINITY_DN3364_c1_g1~~TRINITY_DN3364_c1_g1_i1.p1  ORF type:complete len:1045 (+),score=214.58 TRINITY_DN3364_c1_g1_i1:1531-4665(+)
MPYNRLEEEGEDNSTSSYPERFSERRPPKLKPSHKPNTWLTIPTKEVLLQYIHQTWAEVKKRKLNYILGFFACFLVVSVVSLLMTVLHHAPILLMRLSELQEGEIDLLLYPDTEPGLSFLNHTRISSLLTSNPQYSYNSPRFQLGHDAVAVYSGCEAGLTPADPHDLVWKYSCDQQYSEGCMTSRCAQAIKATVFLVDSIREHKMGIGRRWDASGKEIPEGHAFVHEELANSLGVKTGGTFYLRLDLKKLLRDVWGELAWSYSDEVFDDHVVVPLIISKIYESSMGKHSSDIEDSVVLEYGQVMKMIRANMDPRTPNSVRNGLAKIDLSEYAQFVVFNFPPQRYEVYAQSDQTVIRSRSTLFASNLVYMIGFSDVQTYLPIVEHLSDLDFLSLFLGVVLNIVVIILVLLCGLLVYSLLMVSVDSRSFEIGVARLIGLPRQGVIHLLLVQAVAYALPSTLLGLLFAQILAFIVALAFRLMSGLPVSPFLTFPALLWATLLGLTVPVFASIAPIRAALKRSVLEALSERGRASATNATKVRVERLNSTVNWASVATGVAATAFGMGIYYVVPLALLSGNGALLVDVFVITVLCMLLGLVLLATNIQGLLERALVWILIAPWEAMAVISIVRKNLAGHRRRNRKTAAMYSLALGFVVFVVTSYRLQIDSLALKEQLRYGSELAITSNWGDLNGVRGALEEVVRTSKGQIEEIAWRSSSLNSVLNRGFSISNLGHVFRDSQTLYAVSPNFFRASFPGLAVISQQPSSPYDLAEQLYSELGENRIILGTLYRTLLGLEEQNSTVLIEDTSKVFTGLKPLGFVDVAPLVRFSKFPSSTNQDALVSFPTFARLASLSSAQDVPVSCCLLKISTELSNPEIDAIKSRVQQALASQGWAWQYNLQDYRSYQKIMDQVDIAAQSFFGAAAVIAMVICFFSLASSMYTNVQEQSKEIGVLLAVGLRPVLLVRAFAEEACVLVLAASLLGAFIGIGVGYTVAVQGVLFTQLPVPLVIPWTVLGVVAVASVVLGTAAAWRPSRVLVRAPIVHLLRDM